MGIPPKIVLLGDKAAADKLRGTAQSQLMILQEAMSLSSLKQDGRRLTFSDGSRIDIESSFGQDVIRIYVPPRIEAEVVEEERKKKEIVNIEVLGRNFRAGSGTPELNLCEGAIESVTGELTEECISEEIVVTVTGGTAPYTWSVDNFPVFALGDEDEQEVVTQGTTVSLTTQGGNCNVCGTVSVVDACSETDSLELCTPEVVDDLEWDWDESDEEVEPMDSCTVCVKGGTPPYTWEVESEEFSFDDEVTAGVCNTLNATAFAEGTAVITVTDCCGYSIAGVYAVRCTTGQWAILSYDECCLTGHPDTVAWWPDLYGPCYRARRTLGGLMQDVFHDRHQTTLAHGCDYPGETRWWCNEPPTGNCDAGIGNCLDIPLWFDPTDEYFDGPCSCVEGTSLAGCYSINNQYKATYAREVGYLCWYWAET